MRVQQKDKEKEEDEEWGDDALRLPTTKKEPDGFFPSSSSFVLRGQPAYLRVLSHKPLLLP